MPNRGEGEGKGPYRGVIGNVGHIERFSTKDGGGVTGSVGHIEKFSTKDDGGSKPGSFDVVKRMAQSKKMDGKG